MKKFEDSIRKETIAEEVYIIKDIEYVDCKINGEDFKNTSRSYKIVIIKGH